MPVKRRDLIILFEKKGWYTLRDNGSHEIITDGANTEAIPRHREINEMLAKALIRKWNL